MSHRTPSALPLIGAEQLRLGIRIEAGLLAGEALAREDYSLGTRAELLVIEREGEEARQRFLMANVRLVQSLAEVASRRSGVDCDELFQEGFLGLVQALQRWDWRRGLKFSTFAIHWIRRYVTNFSATDGGRMELSCKTAQRARRLRAIEARLAQELGRSVGYADLVEAGAGSLTTIQQLRGLRVSVPLVEGDIVTTPDDDADDPRLELVPGALSRLTGVERDIVGWRFGLGGEPPMRQSDVGRRLGLSESTVRRYEKRALERLRGVLAAAAA